MIGFRHLAFHSRTRATARSTISTLPFLACVAMRPKRLETKKGSAVSALLAHVEAMDRLGRTVDVGEHFRPKLLGTLFVRLQGLLVPLDGFQCPLAPLAECLVLIAVSILGLFVAPVVEFRRTGDKGAGHTALRGPDAGEVALVVREILLALLLGHRLKVFVQLPFVHGDLVFTDNIGILRAPRVGSAGGIPK